jgi:hypothetical protein
MNKWIKIFLIIVAIVAALLGVGWWLAKDTVKSIFKFVGMKIPYIVIGTKRIEYGKEVNVKKYNGTTIDATIGPNNFLGIRLYQAAGHELTQEQWNKLGMTTKDNVQEFVNDIETSGVEVKRMVISWNKATGKETLRDLVISMICENTENTGVTAENIIDKMEESDFMPFITDIIFDAQIWLLTVAD